MEREAFESWLAAYGHAWETQDSEAFAALFTDDATYQETPFESPMWGQTAIREYAMQASRSQDKVQFSYEVLAVAGDTGIARWRASFVRIPSGASVALDGVFLVVLNDENRCSGFREWWHPQEATPSQGHDWVAEPQARAKPRARN